MDDHMYDEMLSYARCELIPRFQKEYAATHKAAACDSYEEMKDLCTALNAVAKWAGYSRVTPMKFIEELMI